MQEKEILNNVSVEEVREVEQFYKNATKTLRSIDTEVWYLNQDFARRGHINEVHEKAFSTIQEKMVNLECELHKRIYDLHTWIVEQQKYFKGENNYE